MGDRIEGVGQLADIVQLVSGVDVTKLGLTAREGFVLSRVDGATTVEILCQITGLGDQDTLDTLRALRSKGAVVVGDEEPATASGTESASDGSSAGAESGPGAAAADGDSEGEPASSDASQEPSAEEPSKKPTGETASSEKRDSSDMPLDGVDPMVAAELATEDEEGIDLKHAVRLAVRELMPKLDDMTLFELLELPLDADAKAVRRNYFKLSKKYHPDRYYTKNLGHYKDKLAKIFKQITAAYEFLQDDQKREAYRQAVIPAQRQAEELEALGEDSGGTTYSVTKKRERAPVQGPDDRPEATTERERVIREKARALRRTSLLGVHGIGGKKPTPKRRKGPLIEEDDDARAARRAEDRERVRRMRMGGTNPMFARKKKAKNFHQQGLRQLEEGKSLAAAASLKLAMTYDPHVPQYARDYEVAVEGSRATTAEGFFKRAIFEESVGRHDAAARLYQRAADVFPKGVYLIRAADAFLKGEDLKKAEEYATEAVRVEPDSADARLALARVMLSGGDKKRARREVDMARKIEPGNPDAKELLKLIKKL